MVKLQTFLKWGVQNVFGHKIKEVDSVKYVHEVHCIVRARNKTYILRNVEVTGAAKTAAEKYINGTNNVTNDAVSSFFIITGERIMF